MYYESHHAFSVSCLVFSDIYLIFYCTLIETILASVYLPFMEVFNGLFFKCDEVELLLIYLHKNRIFYSL